MSQSPLRAAASLAATMLLMTATSLTAQNNEGERFRIVIPDFFPMQGADDDYGEDVAEALRELMVTLPTHETMTRDEVEDAMDEYDLDWDDMNCPRTRQLTSTIDARLALCAEYEPVGNGQLEVRAAFWDVSSSESFEVTSVTVGEEDAEGAARHIFEEFDLYTQQLRAATFCVDYARSRQWEDALRNCNRALELNPDAISTRYQLARIHFENERYEQALEELERILEDNPIHQAALQLAGYVAGTMGMTDEAVSYYTRYLELDPDNAAVRMRVAYDLADAGDPEGALRLIEVGLESNPDNMDLWEQYGGYAFTLAQKLAQEDTGQDGSEGLPPEAEEHYREAIDAYTRVYEAKGAETSGRHLRSIILGHLRLDELEAAVSMGTEAVELHPDDATLWSAYADALYRSGRLDDALAALDEVRTLDPDYSNLDLRQAKWLVEADRIDEAVTVLEDVAAERPGQADAAARVLFTVGYQNGIREQDYGYAARLLAPARGLPNLSDRQRHELNFWYGYGLFRRAVARQEARTLETAEATLPTFRRVLELLQDVGDYPSTVNVTLSELVDNVNTFIEIQEAIIARGG